MPAAESGRKVWVMVALSIGLLCILQAGLKISLHLTKDSNSTTSDIEAGSRSVMLEMKPTDCDNKTLDIKDRLKTLTEEMNELNKKMTEYKNYLKQGWRYFNFSGNIYYISSERKSWEQSRYDCLQKDADLMIINSKEEQTLTRHLKGKTWIGLINNATEEEWKWVDGTPLNTSFWISGEPNNYGGTEDCGEVRYPEREHNWNDEPCLVKNLWICEKKVPL